MCFRLDTAAPGPWARCRTSDQAPDMFGNCQCGGQPGRLDAEEIHQTGDAMRLRALNQKVGGRASRRLKLGPNPGIPRCQRARGQCGPVTANGSVEALRWPWVDPIVDA